MKIEDFYLKKRTDTKLYDTIHHWLLYHFGHPKYCEFCGKEGKKKKHWNIHWALLRGKIYGKNKESFIGLCASCHEKYDDPEQERKCSLENCNRDYFSKGMCTLHYYRFRYREKYSGHPEKWGKEKYAF